MICVDASAPVLIGVELAVAVSNVAVVFGRVLRSIARATNA
jgi:hypothetical protein